MIKDLPGLVDGPLHTVTAGREHQFGAQVFEKPSPLQAHGLGHGQQESVFPRRADKGQGDPGVAAGGFQDERVRLDQPFPFRGLDHGQSDPVLDTSQGVFELKLGQDGTGKSLGDCVQADQRCVADGPGYIPEDRAHGSASIFLFRKLLACFTLEDQFRPFQEDLGIGGNRFGDPDVPADDRTGADHRFSSQDRGP